MRKPTKPASSHTQFLMSSPTSKYYYIALVESNVKRSVHPSLPCFPVCWFYTLAVYPMQNDLSQRWIVEPPYVVQPALRTAARIPECVSEGARPWSTCTNHTDECIEATDRASEFFFFARCHQYWASWRGIQGHTGNSVRNIDPGHNSFG